MIKKLNARQGSSGNIRAPAEQLLESVLVSLPSHRWGALVPSVD